MTGRADALAGAVRRSVPVFFPSNGLIRVVDELQTDAAPLVQLVDRRAEQSLVRDRYERQLCLELDGVARALGAKVVREVAFTGSDPYMRTGTDVAVILEGNPLVIRPMIAARQLAAAKELGIEPRRLKVAGWDALAVQTPDRRISSWVAATDSMVVVSNGQAQLRRVLETRDGTQASLAGTEEYRWFRRRYRRQRRTLSPWSATPPSAAARPTAACAARRVRPPPAADADAWRMRGPASSPSPRESIVEAVGDRAGGAAGLRAGGVPAPVSELVIDTVTAANSAGTTAGAVRSSVHGRGLIDEPLRRAGGRTRRGRGAGAADRQQRLRLPA